MATTKSKATAAAATAAGPGAGGDMSEPRTYFVIYDDGSVGRIDVEVPGEEPPALSKPGRIVTEAEYQAALDELRGGTEALVQTLRDEDGARQEAEYAELRAAGIPETTARRLSGFTGETEA